DPDGLREAAFRYMFVHNSSGLQQHAHVYCITIDDADPSTPFLARLHDIKPAVKARSACVTNRERGVADKASNERGLVFRVDAITPVDADHARIVGGYYEGGLSASGNTYSAERQNGAWVVIGDVMDWES
ncbi:MAG TPA: hypothetical protein VGH63_16640, partial [Polyangia bacterium]